MTPPRTQSDADAPLPPHKTVYVDTDRVCCDGGGDLGHPRVYYDLDGNGEAHCFYCCAHFIRRAENP